MKELNLGDIQGNILGGFNKDFQQFIFLKFTSGPVGKAWLAEITDKDNPWGIAGSSSKDVLRFNAQFKALKTEGKEPERFIEAAWTNLSISFSGFKALAVKPADLALFPEEFRVGMAARSDTLKDKGASDPANWIKPFGTADIHALSSLRTAKRCSRSALRT